MTKPIEQRVLELDPTAQSAYQFVRHYWDKYGEAPSQREIAEACFIAKGTVSGCLDRLVKANLIRVIRGRPRGIRLLDATD